MSRISAYSRVLKSIAITTLVAGLTAAQALTPAGAKRPAAVPANYVITPFGYFEPSCVTHLAKGDDVRRDEKAILHANGSSDKIQACAFAHYKADGEKVTGMSTPLTRPRSAMPGLNMRAPPRLPPLAICMLTGTSPQRRAPTTARPCTCSLAWRTTRML